MKKKTKKDSLATKKDLNKLASKVDFKNLRIELLKVESRVENLEEGQVRIETKVDRLDERTIKMDKTLNDLRNTLDGFVGVVDNLRKDNEVGADHTRELRVQVDNHEERITTLESI